MKRSPLVVICLIGLVDLSSFGLILPLLPTYAHRFGIGADVLGLMIGAYSISQFICAPILGRWSDRIGRRPILIVSVAGSVFSHVFLGVADLAHSIPMLFVARILDGVTGANIATAQAYIADVTKGTDRARGMGIFGAMMGLGFVVGPAIGGVLMIAGKAYAGEAGTSWPAFGAAIISGVALLLVILYLPESRVHSQEESPPARSHFVLASLPEVVRNPRVAELLLLFLMLTMPFVLLETTFILLCQQRFGVSEQHVMYIFAYLGVLIIIVRGGLVGRLVKRLGEPTVIAAGPFITAAGFFAIGLTDYWPLLGLLLLACIPVAFGNGITEPSMHALLSRQTEASTRGLALGMAASLANLARGVVPFFAGRAYEHSESLPYWLGGVMFVLAGLFAALIKARQQRGLLQGHHGADEDKEGQQS